MAPQRRPRTQATKRSTDSRVVQLRDQPSSQPPRPCNLCGKETRRPKHHFRREHLPFFLYPHTACWVCFSQFSHWPLLRFHADQAHNEDAAYFLPEEMETAWTVRVSDFLFWLATLFGLVSPSALLPLLSTFSLSDEHHDSLSLQRDARVFCGSKANLVSLTEEEYAKLLSWRTLEHLLGLLPPSRRSLHALCPTDQFLGLPGSIQYQHSTIAVDAHFHLDKLLARTKLTSFQSVLNSFSPSSTPYHLAYAIANYCYPEHWSELSAGITDDRVYWCVGFHPRRVDSDSAIPCLFDHLRLLLSHQRAVAVGEVGLDYHPSLEPRTLARQRQMFRSMLQMAFSIKKPVVIHCRGYGQPEAERDCLAIAKEELPRLYPVHRHCFCGSPGELQDWMKTFPNSIYGICATLSKNTYAAVAAQLPLTQTVLESDAPYLPPSRDVKFSTPHHLLPTAEMVAATRGLSTQEVFNQTAATAARFYRIGIAEAFR